MPNTYRRKSHALTDSLLNAPYNYQFIQAVRLLEQASISANKKYNNSSITGFVPPEQETIRFLTRQTLTFPDTEINNISIEKQKSGNHQWKMTVNFMGLTGISGVMPYHYTEMILKRAKFKDFSIRRFFDLFNHRLISLFYKASIKYKLPIAYEKCKLTKQVTTDKITASILSLIGMFDGKVAPDLKLNRENLIGFSGLLSQQIRSESGLRQIVKEIFKTPVKINEFIPENYKLLEDSKTRLPCVDVPQGMNNQLGRNVLIGNTAWTAQSKINIELGPIDSKNATKFAPGSDTLQFLNEIVQLYTGPDIDYDLTLKFRKSVFQHKILLGTNKPPVLGWNSWLFNNTKNQSFNNDTISIKITPVR